MTAIRLDRSPLPRVTKNDSGFLRGEAFVTRTGVFKYVNADGSFRYELRHPDDVFAQKHLDSLKSLPITIDHPTEFVNSENAAMLTKGMTGETVNVDGENVGVTLTITHSDAIEQVTSRKKQELSLGYSLDLIEESGVYNGVAYTHRQTNLDANHLAIVPRARAGAQARINLDGAAVQSDETTEGIQMDKTTTVNLDGLDYQAAPEVAIALTKARNDAADKAAALDEAKEKLSQAEARADAADEAKATLQARIDGLDAEIAAAAKARLALIDDARKLSKDVNLDSSDVEIMKAAILAAKPTANLDGKDDAYIKARFDAAIEDLPTPAQRQTQMTAPTYNNDGAKDYNADLADAIGSQYKGAKK